MISSQINSDDFGVKLDKIRHFTEETQAYLEQPPAIVQEEENGVIKIDLENMSSDSGDDCSVDFESEQNSIAHNSQMDSEV
jgi:hypothetical protein